MASAGGSDLLRPGDSREPPAQHQGGHGGGSLGHPASSLREGARGAPEPQNVGWELSCPGEEQQLQAHERDEGCGTAW